MCRHFKPNVFEKIGELYSGGPLTIINGGPCSDCNLLPSLIWPKGNNLRENDEARLKTTLLDKKKNAGRIYQFNLSLYLFIGMILFKEVGKNSTYFCTMSSVNQKVIKLVKTCLEASSSPECDRTWKIVLPRCAPGIRTIHHLCVASHWWSIRKPSN